MITKQNKQTYNNKDYKYFVVDTINNVIISGWEYIEDARESQLDEVNCTTVYTRRYVDVLIKQYNKAREDYKNTLESYYGYKLDNKDVDKSFRGFLDIQNKLNSQGVNNENN